MLFNDFNYRNKNLSDDFNCVICSFNGSSGVEIGNGANLTFTTFQQRSNYQFMISERKYEEVPALPFQICKTSCNGQPIEFSFDEIRDITDWLQTEKYFKFQPFNAEYDDIIYMGTFTTISPIQFGTKIVGLELTFTSANAWSFGRKKTIKCDLTINNDYKFKLDSDKYGTIYPEKIVITPNEDGELILMNRLEADRLTKISKCFANEKIVLDYTIFDIETDNEAHDVKDSFNYIFPRMNKNYDTKLNTFSSNLSCHMEITYYPIRKVGI